jgi:hypothetical protein
MLAGAKNKLSRHTPSRAKQSFPYLLVCRRDLPETPSPDPTRQSHASCVMQQIDALAFYFLND